MRELTDRNQSDGTILYIMGWNAHHDTGYPVYEPAKELGGRDAFDRLVKLGQDHGLTVMPHVNSWGYDAQTGLLPDYQDYQLRDAHGDLMCYPGGGRWVAETNRLEYVRVGDPRWQAI